jgi:hypothetical protein
VSSFTHTANHIELLSIVAKVLAPIPLPASPLKGEEHLSLPFKGDEHLSLPFKGRVGVGMG